MVVEVTGLTGAGNATYTQYMAAAMNGDRSVRQTLRFDARMAGEELPTVPAKFRGIDGLTGRLVGARLRAGTGEGWLRLRTGRWGKRTVTTVPLTAAQSPVPTPDAVELRGDMRVHCHEGYVGRLYGLTVDTRTGLVIELVVQVRGDVLAEVDLPTSPMMPLVAMSGRRILVSPAWATATKPEDGGLLSRGDELALHLDATAEQLASSTVLRRDEEVAADIWAILDANPALAPYAGGLRCVVHDGDVRLFGTLPSPRHRASAEQDIWHVPGVFALHDETTIAS